ncbi:unnamed protein product, partial [Phaeothamnion confervicola]
GRVASGPAAPRQPPPLPPRASARALQRGTETAGENADDSAAVEAARAETAAACAAAKDARRRAAALEEKVDELKEALRRRDFAARTAAAAHDAAGISHSGGVGDSERRRSMVKELAEQRTRLEDLLRGVATLTRGCDKLLRRYKGALMGPSQRDGDGGGAGTDGVNDDDATWARSAIEPPAWAMDLAAQGRALLVAHVQLSQAITQFSREACLRGKYRLDSAAVAEAGAADVGIGVVTLPAPGHSPQPATAEGLAGGAIVAHAAAFGNANGGTSATAAARRGHPRRIDDCTGGYGHLRAVPAEDDERAAASLADRGGRGEGGLGRMSRAAADLAEVGRQLRRNGPRDDGTTLGKRSSSRRSPNVTAAMSVLANSAIGTIANGCGDRRSGAAGGGDSRRDGGMGRRNGGGGVDGGGASGSGSGCCNGSGGGDAMPAESGVLQADDPSMARICNILAQMEEMSHTLETVLHRRTTVAAIR